MPFLDSHRLRGAFAANALERLVILILEQGDALLSDAGLDFPSRAASTVLLLGERTRISAADLAKELDLPHQLVTQRIDLLIDRGIVSRADDPGDARRRILVLTSKGKRQFKALNARLTLAEAAFAALSAEIGSDLSRAALSAIAALERASVLDRVRALERSGGRFKRSSAKAVSR